MLSLLSSEDTALACTNPQSDTHMNKKDFFLKKIFIYGYIHPLYHLYNCLLK